MIAAGRPGDANEISGTVGQFSQVELAFRPG
jgi:hypothetical protein